MQVIHNCYFRNGSKIPFELPLPDSNTGPYNFVYCIFHSELKDTLEKHYTDCTFTHCTYKKKGT